MPNGWSMGISAAPGAWGKDYFAAAGYVKVGILWQLLDPEAKVNFDDEGNPKNQASKHDIEAYMKLYTEGKNLPGGGVPPPVIFCPKDHRCLVSDGRHRLAAARRLKLDKILVSVFEFHPA